MDWLFEFDRAPHDVTVTATGQALAAEFGQLFESLCVDERFVPGMLILLDLRDVDLDRVPQMELARVTEDLGHLREGCEGCALAIVCTPPLAASLIRSADIGRHAQWMQVWVSCTVDEAITWLESQLALRA
jgi:hypothetical protein